MKPIGISLILIAFVGLTYTQPVFAKSDPDGIQLLIQMEDVFVEIADRVKPAVVNIVAGFSHPSLKGSDAPKRRPPNTPGSGSGIIIDKRGYIVTNNHVVGGGRGG